MSAIDHLTDPTTASGSTPADEPASTTDHLRDRPAHTRYAAAALVALSLMAGACGDATAAPSAPPAAPPTASSTVAPERPDGAPVEVFVDWLDRPERIDLGDGWAIGACEGDAPLLCVTDDGEHAGIVEFMAFPAAPGRYPDDPATEAQLLAEADEFLQVMRDDRATTCADHEFVAADVATTSFGGGPGVRYGFELLDPAGRVVEQVVGHLAIREHGLVVMTANAMVDDGCIMDPEFPGFEPADLARFAPHLGAIAAGSVLPSAEEFMGR